MQRAARQGPLCYTNLQDQPHRTSWPHQATGQACTMCSLGKGQGPQGADWSRGAPPTSPEPGPGPALFQVLGGGRGDFGQFSVLAKYSAGADMPWFFPTILERGPIIATFTMWGTGSERPSLPKVTQRVGGGLRHHWASTPGFRIRET